MGGSQEKSLQAGQVIGPYRIVSSIGGDTSARVYEAEHTFLGVRHALKVFETDAAHVGFLRRRLEAEKSMLIHLRHERIASIYDAGVDEATGLAYYSMDIVLPSNGKPLTLKAIQDSGRIGEDRIAMWFKDICEGVAYLHSKGVVHRDISLENVLIGMDGRAVIYDFGLARIIDDECRKTSRDRSAYLAPELLGGGMPSAASDAWALGVLVYRMLTGTWYASGSSEKISATLAGFQCPWEKVVSMLCAIRPEDRLTEHGGIERIPELLGGVVPVLDVPRTETTAAVRPVRQPTAKSVPVVRPVAAKRPVAAEKPRPAVSAVMRMRMKAVAMAKAAKGPADPTGSAPAVNWTRLVPLIALGVIVVVGGCLFLMKGASWRRSQREELAKESARIAAVKQAAVRAAERAEAEKQRVQSAARQSLSELDSTLNKVDSLDRDDGFFRLQSNCRSKVQEVKRAFVSGRFDLVTNLSEIAQAAMADTLGKDRDRRAARAARIADCQAAREAEAEKATAFDVRAWNAAVAETSSGDQDFDALNFSASKPRYDRAAAAFAALRTAAAEHRRGEAAKETELAALADGLKSARESFVADASWTTTIAALKSMLATLGTDGAKEIVSAELARVELLRSVCRDLHGELRYGKHRATFSVRTSRRAEDLVVFVWNVKKNVQKGDDLTWKAVFEKDDLLYRMFEASRASFVGAGRIRFELAYASYLDLFPNSKDSSRNVVLKLIEGADSAVVTLAAKYFPSIVREATNRTEGRSGALLPLKMPYDKYDWGAKKEISAGKTEVAVRRNEFEEVSSGKAGEVPFDYSMNGGRFTVRDGNEGVVLRWKGDKDGIHLLKQSNRRIGSCKVFTKIPDDVQDVQNAQVDEAADILTKEGDFVIVESMSGRMLVLQVLSARSVKAGDDADNVTFRYMLYR